MLGHRITGSEQADMDPMPKQTIYIAHIMRDEYLTFRTRLPKDPRLPAGYDEWTDETLRTHHAHRGSGSRLEPVVVRWNEFVAYSQGMRIPLSYALLVAYTAELGRAYQKQRLSRPTTEEPLPEDLRAHSNCGVLQRSFWVNSMTGRCAPSPARG